MKLSRLISTLSLATFAGLIVAGFSTPAPKLEAGTNGHAFIFLILAFVGVIAASPFIRRASRV